MFRSLILSLAVACSGDTDCLDEADASLDACNTACASAQTLCEDGCTGDVACEDACGTQAITCLDACDVAHGVAAEACG